jgi:hypothetical protein
LTQTITNHLDCIYISISLSISISISLSLSISISIFNFPFIFIFLSIDLFVFLVDAIWVGNISYCVINSGGVNFIGTDVTWLLILN